jgi:hypothetical protein
MQTACPDLLPPRAAIPAAPSPDAVPRTEAGRPRA